MFQTTEMTTEEKKERVLWLDQRRQYLEATLKTAQAFEIEQLSSVGKAMASKYKFRIESELKGVIREQEEETKQS